MIEEHALNTMKKQKQRPPFLFGNKAENLQRLAPFLTLSKIPAQMTISLQTWRSDPDGTIEQVLTAFPSTRLAVRSCTTSEDTSKMSNAGQFNSQINVEPNPESLTKALEAVITSYGSLDEHQDVLVQPMVDDVAMSGVILTRDLDTGGPYYVINYDDFSGRTDTITGGDKGKTVMVDRANTHALRSPRMRKLVAVAKEIENSTGSSELDIEFCATSDMLVYVLQVRPLAARHKWHIMDDSVVNEALDSVREQLEKTMIPLPPLAGMSTVLGNMPDWNPAEMIGTRPRALADSLYRRLITNEVWAKAREQMGYRMVPHPLMVDLAGHPYVDVRLSLNSFLPATLPDTVANRLVDIQIESLRQNPHFHDKIEFEVAITCRSFDFRQRRNVLAEAGMKPSDIGIFADSLGALTNTAISGGADGIQKLLDQTTPLDSSSPGKDSPEELIMRTRDLLELTTRAGTLPFSILARHAFIGMSFLKTAVARAILSEETVGLLLRSVRTVASDVVADMLKTTTGLLDRDIFIQKYGHLRPGTYEITSPRYDEDVDFYFGATRPMTSEPDTISFELGSKELREITLCLKEEGYAFDAYHLLAYIKAAIAAREQAKFVFSKGISNALLALTRWGEDAGIERDDISFIDYESLLRYHRDIQRLREQAERGKAAHRLARAIHLPHIITEPNDVDVFYTGSVLPNFITSKSVTAHTVHLQGHTSVDLSGKIVLIERADPGFDWIFSHDIAGLVTQYGGANSHMAIRCAEFGLPAAIGCGERLFSRVLKSPVVHLDCGSHKLIER